MTVSQVNFVQRTVAVENKKELFHYNKIFIAPGCR